MRARTRVCLQNLLGSGPHAAAHQEIRLRFFFDLRTGTAPPNPIPPEEEEGYRILPGLRRAALPETGSRILQRSESLLMMTVGGGSGPEVWDFSIGSASTEA